MPRSPCVSRTIRLHSYGVKYINPLEGGNNIYEDVFYLPKEYKTNISITTTLERMYGIHVLLIISHHVANVTMTMPLEEYILKAKVISTEPIEDEYYNDKFVFKKGL